MITTGVLSSAQMVLLFLLFLLSAPMRSNSANSLATEMPFIIIGILDCYFFDGVDTELAHHARAATIDSDRRRRV